MLKLSDRLIARKALSENFSLCLLLLSQKNTRLKKRGFHTERFSYIVLRKGARGAEGELALGKKGGGEKCEGVRVDRN